MTIPSWCYRGAKVVCVNDVAGAYPVPGWGWRGDLHGLTSGEVYTVRSFVYGADGEPCIRLEEIVRGGYSGAFWGGQESGYSINRFRPLVTEQDDLEAHFNQFLTTDHRERV